MINFGAVPAGSVLPVFFGSYDADGASVALTGLAATDIEVYKGTSMTQRASDAGYTLLDTDGIDVDSTTGINAFSIDTGDNTDASFYSVGSFFTVVVSAVTIDGKTVNFVAATFRIVAAEGSAGTPKADVSHISGSSVSTSSAQLGVNVVNAAGTAWASGAITAAVIATDAIDDDAIATGAIASTAFAAGAITASAIAADAIGASELAADAATEIGTAVWATAARTLTALDEDNTTLDLDDTIRSAVGLASANLDTQLGDLPTNSELSTALGTADDAVLAAVSTVDSNVDAIKAKTDNLNFGVTGKVDANITHVNETEVTGDGQTGTEWGPA